MLGPRRRHSREHSQINTHKHSTLPALPALPHPPRPEPGPTNTPCPHLPCRRFSVGERMAAFSTDPFMNAVSAIRIFNIAEDPAEQSSEVGAP